MTEITRNPGRPNSKWGKRGTRVDASLRIEDARWIWTAKGWRHVTDSVSEEDWVMRRRMHPSFRQGAARGSVRAAFEPVPRNKPAHTERATIRNLFAGPAGARTFGGLPFCKDPRELRNWARSVEVRGKPAIDTGIRKALTHSTYALVVWPDQRRDWVHTGTLDAVEQGLRYGLEVVA